MKDLTFERFAEFVRGGASLAKRAVIVPETQFERDLGITGDDGIELLAATEREYCVSLSSGEGSCRETFDLGLNEYLFHAEGLDLLSLFKKYTVREFTVGELYRAVQRQSSSTKS